MLAALEQNHARTSTDPDALLLAVRDHRDREAFLELFRQFAPRVKGWLVRGGLPSTRSDEITQDVMMRVWRRSESWSPERGKASTWIFAIARNARVDALRKKRLPTWHADDPVLVADPADGPLATSVQSQRAGHLRQALSTLPEDQADVLRAAYFEHQSMREIASARSIPVGTVKSRVRLAMARLRLALGPVFEESP